MGFYYTYCVAWVNDETLYALATARLTLVSFSCALCCKKRGEKTRVKSIQYASKAVQIHKSKIIWIYESYEIYLIYNIKSRKCVSF